MPALASSLRRVLVYLTEANHSPLGSSGFAGRRKGKMREQVRAEGVFGASVNQAVLFCARVSVERPATAE